LIWLNAGPPRTTAAVAPSPTSPGQKPIPMYGPAPVGVSGCAAAACHGNPTAITLTGSPDRECGYSSATHFLSGDPHTRAYAVLTGPLGQAIMDRLHKANPNLPTSAAEYDRCLACHTNPSLAKPDAFGLSAGHLKQLRSEGVGCEACHGNAGKWLTTHTVENSAYPPTGMTDLNNIGERAVACAGCHIGAPANEKSGYAVVRDMNHDMIAAGHPRLNFELTDYQRRLPPHWFERERTVAGQPARDSHFEAKAWLVGRVAVAEAACRLLADRANRSDPWPEFAEFNCFACHHNLQPESWRQTAPHYFTGRKPGALPWQTLWPVTQPKQLSSLTGYPQVVPAADAMTALLNTFAPTRPPRSAETAAAAAQASYHLTAVRQAFAAPTAKVSPVPIFRAASNDLERTGWDEAGQVFQGLAALERSRSHPDHGIDTRFDSLRERLLLPFSTTGPRFNSPRDYYPEKIRSDLSGLIDVELKFFNTDPTSWPK
jgi:hypothetical protein